MRIKIDKFANINNVDLEFSNQMNILIGDNGTGKKHIVRLTIQLFHI